MSNDASILIVDDEPNVQLVFRTALETEGYPIVTACTGEEALAQLARSPFQLVLLDLSMPVLDGMETLRRLRESGSNVPVVIITAHGSIPHAVEAMKLGAIDFLTKPMPPNLLREKVAEVLARHRGKSSAAPEPARKAEAAPPITAASQFAFNMTQAKRALNCRWFDEADVYLKQAVALDPHSAEAHNLMGVLHELRGEHDASYRSYKAALKADRHYEPAQHNMRRYYERFTFGTSQVPIDEGDS